MRGNTPNGAVATKGRIFPLQEKQVEYLIFHYTKILPQTEIWHTCSTTKRK